MFNTQCLLIKAATGNGYNSSSLQSFHHRMHSERRLVQARVLLVKCGYNADPTTKISWLSAVTTADKLCNMSRNVHASLHQSLVCIVHIVKQVIKLPGDKQQVVPWGNHQQRRVLWRMRAGGVEGGVVCDGKCCAHGAATLARSFLKSDARKPGLSSLTNTFFT